MLSKIQKYPLFCTTEYPPPKLELIMEDFTTLDTLDVTSPEYLPPPTPENWHLSWRTLCGGLVCGDYRCTPLQINSQLILISDKILICREIKSRKVEEGLNQNKIKIIQIQCYVTTWHNWLGM